MKILAIDDNRDNLTTLKAVVLDRLPEIQVLTATSGQEGLALAVKSWFKFVTYFLAFLFRLSV